VLRSTHERPIVWGETQLRAMLDFAPDAMLVIDASGRIALVNVQAERVFGVSREEILHRPVEVLMPDRFHSRHLEHRRAYQRDPRVRPMGAGATLFARRGDGTEFPVEISLSPLQTDRGQLVMAAIRDVSERNRAERILREKYLELEAANFAKTRFLASMSHELRTPLNAIIGFTGTLLMRLPGPLTRDQDDQLRTVQTSARHLLSLINDLLDLAKIESGKIEVHVEEVSCRGLVGEITDALGPLAGAKGLAFSVEPMDGDLVLMTDRRAVKQIVINLASNAITFTEKGSVRLACSRTPDKDWTTISVTDTGRGIRPEDRVRLFQPFEQLESTGGRRHEGTGLGLHLSQKLAALLGGHITVASEYGAGSTFTLVLPERS
jgi:PAS domain S-box-containing protein